MICQICGEDFTPKKPSWADSEDSPIRTNVRIVLGTDKTIGDVDLCSKCVGMLIHHSTSDDFPEYYAQFLGKVRYGKFLEEEEEATSADPPVEESPVEDPSPTEVDEDEDPREEFLETEDSDAFDKLEDGAILTEDMLAELGM